METLLLWDLLVLSSQVDVSLDEQESKVHLGDVLGLREGVYVRYVDPERRTGMNYDALYSVTFTCDSGATAYEASRQAYELMKDTGIPHIFVIHNDRKYRVRLAMEETETTPK